MKIEERILKIERICSGYLDVAKGNVAIIVLEVEYIDQKGRYWKKYIYRAVEVPEIMTEYSEIL